MPSEPDEDLHEALRGLIARHGLPSVRQALSTLAGPERAVREQAPGKPGPKRGTLLVLLGCGSLLLAALMVFAIMSLGLWSMTSTGAYAEALQRARENAELVQAIGTPIEPGYFVTGTVSTSGPGGTADLAIPVSGPGGKGKLYVKAAKVAGRWEMQLLEAEVRGRPERINLLAQTPPAAVPPAEAR